jgi:superfamily II DNA helicase RecQ
VLPTGYGKSLVFYLTPALLFAKKSCVLNLAGKIVIVVSPSNALIENQINRLSLHGIDVKCSTSTSSSTHRRLVIL